MKKKILLYIYNLKPGGAEGVFVKIANYLYSDGYDVKVALTKKEGQLIDNLNRNIEIIDLRSSHIIFSIFPLVKYLYKWKPDYILSTLKENNAIAILSSIVFFKRCKVYIREANTLSAELKQGNYINRIVKKSLVIITYPFADKIVVLSNNMKEDLSKTVRFINQGNVSVIYNPVNREEVIYMSKENINEHLFDNNYPILCSAARVVPHKGYVTIIKALGILKKKGIKFNFIALGDGPDINKLKLLSKELGLDNNVRFLGYVRNPFKYITISKVFILASEYEGMPNSLIQAMSLGVPVISSDSPGASSEVLCNGVLGGLFSVGNEKELSNLILEKLLNGQEIYNFKLERFDEDKILKKYSELFSD